MRLLILLGAIFFIVASQSLAGDKEDVAALAKVSKDAEVHTVAVYEPKKEEIGPDDIVAWKKLFDALLDAKNAQAQAVRAHLSKRGEKFLGQKELIEEVIARPRERTSDGVELRDEILGMIRRALEDPTFWDAPAFAKVPRSPLAKQLIALGEKRSQWQTARLNWEFISAALPGALAEFPTDYRTVRVRVRSDKDIVLVLSGHRPTRWDVEVTPGSRVVGIISCGYWAQHIEVYENPVKTPPVVHRTYYNPNGTRRNYERGLEEFGTDQQKSPEFAAFVKGVKNLTGKEFASFQGGYRPKPKEEPFLVPPKK